LPYVIENVTIDGQNSANCIEIRDSAKHFIVENCTVYNSGSVYWSAYAGILLDHVINGALINNNFSNNCIGIGLVWSNNNTIYGNIANDNTDSGIMLNTQCSNNTVSGNTANNNGHSGIIINWNSNNNTISGNTANMNNKGIQLFRTENNSIMGNTITGSSSSGIEVSFTNYTLFFENTISFNQGNGINIKTCENITI